MKVLIVGDDNFTFTPSFLENREQWLSKLTKSTESSDGSSTAAVSEETLQPALNGGSWAVEVACCLAVNKVPTEYQQDLRRLQQKGLPIHFSVNPALLRQYFPAADGGGGGGLDKRGTGPPYDIVLFILPGLQFEGCPQYIEKNSELFKLRLHLYWFALAKSSTVITHPNGRILYLWIEQENVSRNNVLMQQLPFPLVDIHKLVTRSESEDFRLNLSWGEYKTRWKPLVHNTELLHFPRYLEDLKVYCFRNTPYVAPPQDPAVKADAAKQADDINILRIPHSICQWDRNVLPHVNEIFHFNMRTCIPGEMLQISKLSVKYDPRITGWRNLGHGARDQYRQPTQPTSAVQQPQQPVTPQQLAPSLPNIYSNTWGYPAPEAAGGGYGEPSSYGACPQGPYHTQGPYVPPAAVQHAPVVPADTQPAPAAQSVPQYETGLYDTAGWNAFSAGYWPPTPQPATTAPPLVPSSLYGGGYRNPPAGAGGDPGYNSQPSPYHHQTSEPPRSYPPSQQQGADEGHTSSSITGTSHHESTWGGGQQQQQQPYHDVLPVERPRRLSGEWGAEPPPLRTATLSAQAHKSRNRGGGSDNYRRQGREEPGNEGGGRGPYDRYSDGGQQQQSGRKNNGWTHSSSSGRGGGAYAPQRRSRRKDQAGEAD